MFNDGPQSATFVPQNPAGENVTIYVADRNERGYLARLPATVVTNPSSFYSVVGKVHQTCYEVTFAKMDQDIDMSYWFNIFNGLGFFIDFFNGHMWKYDSSTVIKVNPIANCVAREQYAGRM